MSSEQKLDIVTLMRLAGIKMSDLYENISSGENIQVNPNIDLVILGQTVEYLSELFKTRQGPAATYNISANENYQNQLRKFMLEVLGFKISTLIMYLDVNDLKQEIRKDVFLPINTVIEHAKVVSTLVSKNGFKD